MVLEDGGGPDAFTRIIVGPLADLLQPSPFYGPMKFQPPRNEGGNFTPATVGRCGHRAHERQRREVHAALSCALPAA